MSLIFLFISISCAIGIQEYEKPDILTKIGASFYSFIDTGKPDNYATHRQHPTIVGDVFQEFVLLKDDNRTITDKEITNKAIKSYIGELLIIACLILLILTWGIIWCCIQCCKCCCFRQREYVNPTCCWGEEGPSRGLAMTTKALFFIVSLLFLAPLAFSTISAFKLRTLNQRQFDMIINGTANTSSTFVLLKDFPNITKPFEPTLKSIAEEELVDPEVREVANSTLSSIDDAKSFLNGWANSLTDDINKIHDEVVKRKKLKLSDQISWGWIGLICLMLIIGVSEFVCATVSCLCCGYRGFGCRVCCAFATSVTIGLLGLIVSGIALSLEQAGYFLYNGGVIDLFGREKVLNEIESSFNGYLGNTTNPYSAGFYIKFNRAVFVHTLGEYTNGTNGADTSPIIQDIQNAITLFGSHLDTLSYPNETNPLWPTAPGATLPQEVLEQLATTCEASRAARETYTSSVIPRLAPAFIGETVSPIFTSLFEMGHLFSLFWLSIICYLALSIFSIILQIIGRKFWEKYEMERTYAGDTIFYPSYTEEAKNISNSGHTGGSSSYRPKSQSYQSSRWGARDESEPLLPNKYGYTETRPTYSAPKYTIQAL